MEHPSNGINSFPWEIQDVDPLQVAQIKSLFPNYLGHENDSFIRVGPSGYLYPSQYREVASKIYNMTIKPTDVFVASFPRSGTTWTQELVWLVANDLDYKVAADVPLICRYPSLDATQIYMATRATPTLLLNLPENYKTNRHRLYSILNSVQYLESAADPRFIKAHLPLSLLPPFTLDTAKMVYVARDPRDVVVSFYHYTRSLKMFGYSGDFKTFWTSFINDLVIRCPYFPHVKEAWKQRHHPNMLFIFYEDMIKDLPAIINRMATFFNKRYSKDQITELCEHLRMENFKKNRSVAMDVLLKQWDQIVPGEQRLIRKGQSGDWRNYFDEEMLQQAEQWMEDNLRDTDLQFPSIN